jgi:hypothetical protein
MAGNSQGKETEICSKKNRGKEGKEKERGCEKK